MTSLGSKIATLHGPMIDLQLFAYLAIGVAIVGTYLWFKPSKNAPKYSGVGDQGQKD